MKNIAVKEMMAIQHNVKSSAVKVEFLESVCSKGKTDYTFSVSINKWVSNVGEPNKEVTEKFTVTVSSIDITDLDLPQ